LTSDGRISNRGIAAVVGRSEATVASRIRNLQSQRILGVSVLLDWAAAGYEWDLTVRVQVRGRAVDDVAADLAELRYVHWVMVVFGGADIVLHIQAPSRTSVVALLTEDLPAIDGVADFAASVNLETLKYDVRFARLPVRPTTLEFPDPVVDLDETDRSLVESLMVDGRRSNRELARLIGVSEGTIRARLGRLEDAGLLRICGQVDPYRIGQIGAWAYVAIDVDGASARRVAESLVSMPEVLIVNMCVGPAILSAFVVAENRTALVDDALARIRALPQIAGTTVTEVSRTIKLDYHWARLIAPAQP
jgi:DNA-binding Lrp family transcriptional regulator